MKNTINFIASPPYPSNDGHVRLVAHFHIELAWHVPARDGIGERFVPPRLHADIIPQRALRAAMLERGHIRHGEKSIDLGVHYFSLGLLY